MHRESPDFEEALRSAEMRIDPDPVHAASVRRRLATMTGGGTGSKRPARTAWLIVLLVCCVGGAGLAATETGRSVVRWILTPVLPRHEVTVTTPDGTTWTRGGSTRPYTPEQLRTAGTQFGEIAGLKRAGLGELVGLLEGPDGMIWLIEYALEDRTTTTVATAVLSEAQAVNLRIDEIQRLRDAGAGRTIVESRSPIGLGHYVIRFALPDRTVDLEAWFPPGTREQREAIFAETRTLKADLLFSVEEASVSVEDPQQGVVGTLRYTLADGRTVGIMERVPDEIILPGGKYVLVPGTGASIPIESGGTWRAPDGSRYSSGGGEANTVDDLREVYAIKESGGGRLIGLVERPGWDGERSTTSFRIEYTLKSGETMIVGDGALSARQETNMRIDEILQLRDAGEGNVVSRGESALGLGRFTIRFALSDGSTVQLQTLYPPTTREEREAIFAETRQLKAQRRFSLDEARIAPGSGVWARFVYTLSDGRTVRHYEQVPSDLITSDGTHIVMPGTGETVEITGAAQD